MLKIFSVFDSKVNAYMNPIYLRSAGEAIRAFGSSCSEAGSDFARYAEDYTLFELGEYDELTAKFTLHATPLPLCKAIECSSKHRDYYFASRDVAA